MIPRLRACYGLTPDEVWAMPRGELVEYLAQLPAVVEIISGGAVKLEPPDDDDG